MLDLGLEKQTFKIQNRLKVVHLKRPGFLKTYAALIFPVGGLHRAYQDSSIHYFPAGAAHFLEHKCFERDGEEMTDVFSRQGASANAYTTYQSTSYVFEAIENLEANLLTLCDMAFNPQFTEAGIEKEKGIIVQEWSMYQDSPFYRQYQLMQEVLYQDHPYALDILGQKESIEAMDLNTLNAIHEAYYQPETATLVIAGDLDLSEIITALDKKLTFPKPTTKRPVAIEGAFIDVEKDLVIEDDVQDEYMVFGYRMPYQTDLFQRYHHYMALDIALDSVFGSSSHFYEKALDEGLISDNFFTEISFYDNVYDVTMASQTKAPEAFKKAIDALLLEPAKEVIDETLFHRLKKAGIGSFIFSLESLEGMVRSYTRYLHDGISEEDLLKIQNDLTFEDVLSAYQTFQNARSKVTVLLKPSKETLNKQKNKLS